jgi:hypothetical protein
MELRRDFKQLPNDESSQDFQIDGRNGSCSWAGRSERAKTEDGDLPSVLSSKKWKFLIRWHSQTDQRGAWDFPADYHVKNMDVH